MLSLSRWMARLTLLCRRGVRELAERQEISPFHFTRSRLEAKGNDESFIRELLRVLTFVWLSLFLRYYVCVTS